MAFNCFGVSGCASESFLAAAVMALSSSTVGMRIVGRLEIFDIVFHLATIGAAQADDPPHFASIYICHVVQNFGFRCESNYSRLTVLESFINPHQRGCPIEVACHRQRHTVLCLVSCVLGGIELDSHGFTVATLKENVKRRAWRLSMGANVPARQQPEAEGWREPKSVQAMNLSRFHYGKPPNKSNPYADSAQLHLPDDIDEHAVTVVAQVGEIVGKVGEVVACADLHVVAEVAVDR